ncbi:MAG: DUF4111 domain-containing protein [Chloroflexi bacterium]|nr:DUF4111 domain-containing protein [Chloroflexota bacterium]
MSPAVPEPIRQTMQALAARLSGALGGRLLGVYLGGSASLDDFAAASSDLDFLVVTDGPLTEGDLAAVAAIHEALRGETPLGDRLEGDYAPHDVLVPAGTLVPVPEVRAGLLNPDPGAIMLSADNIANMRAHGLTFLGPEPPALLPEATDDDVRAAVREMLDDGPETPETPAEAAAEILNLVRSLWALESGRPTTKSEGAAWALAQLDERWHPALRAALAVRNGQASAADEATVLQSLAPMYRALWPGA